MSGICTTQKCVVFLYMSSLLEDRNGQYTSISGGVGTTVVKNTSGVLQRVLISGTAVGTLQLHDAPSAAGTTSTSMFYQVILPWPNVPTVLEMGVNFKNGLVYQATGTPVATLVWE